MGHRMLASDGRIDLSGPRTCFDVQCIQRGGLIRAIRPGWDASAGLVAQLVPDHAAHLVQRNGVFVFHIARRMTASFRATAMYAFLKPDTFANFMPQIFRGEDRNLHVSKVVAAS